MAAEKSRAVVLRSFPFGETSCVVVLYCRDFGKVRALAKGAWRPKSGFDGGLDLLSISQVLVLRKSSGGLDLLTEAALERRFRVGTSLAAVLGGLHVAELLDALTADADPQPELFDEAHATLRRLSDWQGDEAGLPGILVASELALLRLTGHGPELHACVECHAPLAAGGRTAFGMLDGGTLCPRCRGGRRGVVSVSATGLATLRSLADAPRAGDVPPLPAAVAGEVRSIMTTYLSHLLGRPLRVPSHASRTAARRRSR
jgi:DNA repair protein RecO (recombination protein O)